MAELKITEEAGERFRRILLDARERSGLSLDAIVDRLWERGQEVDRIKVHHMFRNVPSHNPLRNEKRREFLRELVDVIGANKNEINRLLGGL